MGTEQDADRVYLDLVPVRSFLHTSGGGKVTPAKETSRHSPIPSEEQKIPSCQIKEVGKQRCTHVYLSYLVFVTYSVYQDRCNVILSSIPNPSVKKAIQQVNYCLS